MSDNGNGRYIEFVNWPQDDTVEQIEIRKDLMDFWTITTAEELMSDLSLTQRARKIGMEKHTYQALRSKYMYLDEDRKWQIKIIQN